MFVSVVVSCVFFAHLCLHIFSDCCRQFSHIIILLLLCVCVCVCLQFSLPAGCRANVSPVPRCSTPALLVAACLPSDADLFILMRSSMAIAAAAAEQQEVAPLLAHKLIKATLEGAAAVPGRPAHSPIRGVDPMCKARGDSLILVCLCGFLCLYLLLLRLSRSLAAAG